MYYNPTTEAQKLATIKEIRTKLTPLTKLLKEQEGIKNANKKAIQSIPTLIKEADKLITSFNTRDPSLANPKDTNLNNKFKNTTLGENLYNETKKIADTWINLLMTTSTPNDTPYGKARIEFDYTNNKENLAQKNETHITTSRRKEAFGVSIVPLFDTQTFIDFLQGKPIKDTLGQLSFNANSKIDNLDFLPVTLKQAIGSDGKSAFTDSHLHYNYTSNAQSNIAVANTTISVISPQIESLTQSLESLLSPSKDVSKISSMVGFGVNAGYKWFFGNKKRNGIRAYGFYDYAYSKAFHGVSINNSIYGVGADYLYNFIDSKKLVLGAFVGFALAGSSWNNSDKAFWENLKKENKGASMHTSYFQIPLVYGLRFNFNKHNGFELGMKVPLAKNSYYQTSKGSLSYKRVAVFFANYVYNFNF
ncbi:outer membrane protein [Helicobacter cetorum]|uniref:Outer membrane protein (Omp22) n=1 Tax=Helicobacter cetorum (strain ATCC BAA-540 / CCUG 52418 / MIT 99-5656) TaxID=1163745 RepID=I0EUP5_HELCM|nr:outer membrane protein [Helicobacter cetorum]AFI06664.1 outer membrane protein (omp22) [Helicobacter cetorum MIT 99-5656]